MLDRIKMIKRKMDESLEQLCKVSWMFSKQPEKDFIRERKLSFSKLVSFLLAMEGGTLTTELLKHFGCSSDIASAPAFVQQRSKLAPETFLLYSICLFAKLSLLGYIRAFAYLLQMAQISRFRTIQNISVPTIRVSTVNLL